MHITHDRENNIGYIRFQPQRTGIETIILSSDLHVDLAPDGSLYGIELMNANEQLGADGDVLQFLNANTKELKEFPLA